MRIPESRKLKKVGKTETLCVTCWHEWLQRGNPIHSESPSSSIILSINYNWSICVPGISDYLYSNQNDPHAVRLCLRLLSDLKTRLQNASVSWKKDKDSQMGLMRALHITAMANFNREIRGSALNNHQPERQSAVHFNVVIKPNYQAKITSPDSEILSNQTDYHVRQTIQ